MNGSYNIALVALSYIVAVAASLSALDLAAHVTKAKQRQRRWWLIGGAITMGCGIWAMHFIGMLAYEMDHSVQYDAFLTIISGFFTIIVSGLALYLVAIKNISLSRIIAGGLIMGAGIASMHYVGMEAMIMPVTISYEPVLFTISLVIAVVAAIAALKLAIAFSGDKYRKYWHLKLVSALVMGAAIAGMHYTGMAAAIYTPIPDAEPAGFGLDSQLLAISIATITFLIIAVAALASGSSNTTSSYKHLGLLIVNMTIVTVIVASASIFLLYEAAHKQQAIYLQEITHSQASLLSAVARFDAVNSTDNHKDGAAGATISQFIDAHSKQKGFSETGGFILARKDGDIIELITDNRAHHYEHDGQNEYERERLTVNNKGAEPFLRAFNGQSGHMVTLDHVRDNALIIAAYEQVPELGVAIIAQIDLSEVRAPFIKAGIIAAVISLISIIIAATIIYSVINPVIHKLQDEVTHRKDAEDDLRDVNENLENIVFERTTDLTQALVLSEAAAKSKSAFLANMSHEIRTPMNGVLGMLSLLDNTKLTDEQGQYCSTAYHSAETLLSLLNDILDFSKIEAGKLDLESIDFKLIELIEESAGLMAEAAHRKNLELITDIDPTIPAHTIGDPTRLRQVIINLTSNAIKFTSEGEISINARVVEDDDEYQTIRFEIKDTGIGIAEEQIGKVFNSFEQADGSTTRNFGGTGLGLSISTQLSHLMGGEIGVESEQGVGSTFWFTIRAKKSSQSEENRSRIASQLHNVHALIVDDNHTNRLILERHLSAWGISYKSAEDGKEALALLESEHKNGKPFTLALLDMMMPGMNGIELAQNIYSQDKYSSLKSIMLTSLSKEEESKHAKQAGIHAWITKPVRMSFLFNTIITVMNDDSSHAESLTASPQVEVVQHTETLLVAEDNPVNQKVVIGMLKKLGYSADIANNGQEAVDAVMANHYDLILMDCHMPVMDGYEATRAIREAMPQSELHIIALTANAMPGDEERCLKVGMNGYLPKPLCIDDLKEKLEAFLPGT